MSFFTIGSVKRRPIRRLIAKKVFSGFVTAWRLAAWPTRRSPDSVNATIEGVVRMPSLLSITLALLPSITATQEFVVPRSIPITLAIATSCFSRVSQPPQALRQTPLRIGPSREIAVPGRAYIWLAVPPYNGEGGRPGNVTPRPEIWGGRGQRYKAAARYSADEFA